MARALISLPANPRRGQIIEVKALIAHDMETGFRRTQFGALIARDIVTDFVCMYNGEEVFGAQLHPAIAANPYLAFSLMLAAGMNGIEQGLELPPEAPTNVFELTPEDVARRLVVSDGHGANLMP